MKPLHAAALALVGWYLMVLPTAHEEDWQPGSPPTTASLSDWFIWNSFDAADACENAKDALFWRASENSSNDYHRWLAGRAWSDACLTNGPVPTASPLPSTMRIGSRSASRPTIRASREINCRCFPAMRRAQPTGAGRFEVKPETKLRNNSTRTGSAGIRVSRS